ncbi:MAG: sigma-E factor negative regulatory protein [Gammaproteobacteria bacterium]
MTMNSHEQLSALLDGELPEAEVAMAIRRVARDDVLRGAALRYSLIGDALRDELPAGRPANLVERVRAQLDAEPVPVTGAPAGFARFTKWGAGFAVAASVAMVALVALPGRQQDLPPPVLTATDIAVPGPEQRIGAPPVYTRAAGGGPDRLTRYYVNHTEYAPPMSGRGALTRIIVIQPRAASPEDDVPEYSPAVPEENGTPQ